MVEFLGIHVILSEHSPEAPEMTPTIGIAVITHRSRQHLPRCLPPLLASPLQPRVLVVNSSSGDGTVELAREMGAEVMLVPRRSFNHGVTREQARQTLGTDIVVMLTPDAYPERADFVERLTSPIRRGLAAVAYGRQIPHGGADLFERFGRAFSYPPTSHLRSMGDWPQYGSYTHFCSNACAAWSSRALDSIGGFRPTLVSEETIATAELLARGERIAYVADALVRHSHHYRLRDEFRRSFVVGCPRQLYRRLLLRRGTDAARGRAYLKALLRAVMAESPWRLPEALLHTAVRYAGYRTGLLGTRLPSALAAHLSGQDFFWDSDIARQLGVPAASTGAPAMG
jgi:rhamnosyltransferase